MKNNQLTKIKKIKIFFSNLWFRYIKKPFYYKLIVEPRIKREHAIKIAKLKKEFEEKQKISVQRIKEVMFHEKTYSEYNPKFNYLNQKLLEGREHIIGVSKYTSKTPFFYEPEICDIHNENIDLTKKNINQIIIDENNSCLSSLKKQEDVLNSSLVLKPKKTFTNTVKKDEDFLDTINNIEDIVSLNQLREWDSEEQKLKHETLIKNLNSVLKK